ncbi:MAG: TSUP family transporter [Parasporobacterium sp.]|nr:TSUP family transporter [Parasporobacterium sp.]
MLTELSIKSFLIVCPLVFFAGLVDSIAGGGGLISLPAYLIAGLPSHEAIATNKLSSACGTCLTTIRFIRQRLVDLKLAVLTVIAAAAGSFAGARLSLRMDERILRVLLIILLPLAAAIVLNKKLFQKNNDSSEHICLDRRTIISVVLSALLIGGYDGFYGPGTGTFLIIAFTVFARMSVHQANAQAKVINLTTNVASLTVYLLSGKVVILLGIAGAISNMAGNYIGSGLALSKGERIIRPMMIVVLVILLIRVIIELV